MNFVKTQTFNIWCDPRGLFRASPNLAWIRIKRVSPFTDWRTYREQLSEVLGLGLNISQLTAFSGCQLSIHRDSQRKHLVHHLKGSPAENIRVTIILPNLSSKRLKRYDS